MTQKPATARTLSHPLLTEFQALVYAVVRRIPRGRVATYAQVARAAGCASPRAVGQALRRNPFAPHVPCHRVIASDGRAGGFAGQQHGAALRRKLALLRREGVTFRRGRLADPNRLVELAHLRPQRGISSVDRGSSPP